MSKIWKLAIISFLVFFFSWFFAYKANINPLAIQSEDTLPAMFLPVAIIKEKTLYLDSYYKMMLGKYPHPDDKTFEKELTPFYLKKVIAKDGTAHFVSAFPLMAGILSIPIYFLPLLLGMPTSFENLIILAHLASAIIVSISGVFLYVLLKKHFSLDEKASVVLTLVYLFGTANYAMASQSLWQHGTLQLFIIAYMFCLFEFISNTAHKRYAILSGLVVGFAVLSRPTSALIIPFTLLLVVERLEITRELANASFLYICGLFLPLLFFFWYNTVFYVDIANQGYTDQLFVNWLGKFPEGFIGTWFSPSKGILIYSPVFVFSLVGFYLAMAKKAWRGNLKYLVFGCIVVLHTLFMGSWKHWFGGWSYGYRMASDVIPFLILLMVPYMSSPFFERTKVWFYGLLGVSALVQIFGIFFFDGIWHAAYDTGYKNTAWLWSIKDSEFAFNVRRIFVKFGLLEKACEKCLPGKV